MISRAYLFLVFMCMVSSASAQRLETDIFGNLDYSSQDGKYTATLEKNIFNDLIFSDSEKNKISYEKKYLDKMFPGILNNKKRQTELMWSLLRENRKSTGYVATYKIDIFDKVIIEDNQGYKWEQGTDIFGHVQTEEEFDGIKRSVKRNIHGYLEATIDKDKASLKKDIFDKWIYEDNLGNKFQFGAQTWKRLIQRFRTDEGVFAFLLEEYFY